LLKHGIYAVVAGEGTPNEADVQPWIEGVRAATDAIGRKQNEFAWAAIIGPVSRLEGGDQHFEGKGKVGPLALRSGGVRYDELTDSASPSMHGRSRRWSWPIVVEGSAHGYDWFAALRFAGTDLHRLCGLLTVAWDRNWAVREAPQAMQRGELTVPDRPWWEKPDETTSSDNLHETLVALPDWLDEAWQRVGHDVELAHALAIYQEGMAIQHEHPSVANVAYVAAIETLGARLVKLKHCKTCGASKGSAERFRSALRHVVSAADASLLAEMYKPRSTTAHAGRLHGTEAFGGAFLPPGFFGVLSLKSPDSFSIVVYRMRIACRKLLEFALKGDFPPKSPEGSSLS
jgi:hypothetical protein